MVQSGNYDKYTIVKTALLLKLWLYIIITIIRLHCSTMKMQPIIIDRVAWSVGLSVCLSVCWSVCQSRTVVRPSKTAEPIQMPFGLMTWMSPRNHVLDGGQHHLMGRGPLQSIGTLCSHLCKNGWTMVMPFELWPWTGPSNHKLDRGPDPHGKGQFWGKGAPSVKYRDFLPWAVRKWLNRSICCLDCGLG